MTGDMLMEAWGDTMIATAVLVMAVLLVRKPFARRFGPGLTYALWLVPAFRLVLPPLPFADPVVLPAAPVAAPVDAALWDVATVIEAGAPAAHAVPAQAAWAVTDALPFLFGLWALGAVAVLVSALAAHQRFRREVLAEAVELEPIGTIRLVMTDAVDGPVAFGLLRRFVAVPHDFFARYVAEERALAIDHELAHHRHGDLWANGAALLLLATQWFNPMAWRAIRAFRFDQEAACDARVLTMADSAPRGERTARYATAIAKAAVGSRLSLAAPMAVHDNLQERLTMLMQDDISKRRGAVGRLLLGSAAIAALASTATLVPAGISRAATQATELPEPPQPPAPPLPPEAPPPEAALEGHRVMVFTGEDDGEAARDGERREVTRIIVREGEKTAGKAGGVARAPADGKARHIEFRMPGSLSREEILTTLREQGVTGGQADAIADKLAAKGRRGIALAPVPPLPPTPPAAWSAVDGKAFAFAHCGKGKDAAPIVDREDANGDKRSRVVMMHCGSSFEKSAQIAALKRTRDGFAGGEVAGKLTDEIRAKVIADLDRAIAKLEKLDD